MTQVQTFALNTLKTFRCLRDEQLCKLVDSKYGGTFARQLAGFIAVCPIVRRPSDGYVGMAGATVDDDIIAACGVMLEYLGHGLTTYSVCEPPFRLVFCRERPKKPPRVYAVVVVHDGEDWRDISNPMGYAVIFVVDEVPLTDTISYEHYFAVLGENGYNFY
ncbi:hypothetical protein FACS18949_13080 [Clostridia bacterium]|nr:hypothetical protein FACS18949_13080 [Clostridia bacterium]